MGKSKKIPILNREISWLHFNGRVLQEAADPRNPLLERLKFLGIFSNNRDEFFRVRVATINRMATMGYNRTDYKINPKKVLQEINEIVISQERDFMSIYQTIVSELTGQNIHIISENELTEEQGDFVRKYFHEKVRVYLFPIIIGSVAALSSLRDKSIYLAVTLGRKDKPKKEDVALIELPTKAVSRFLVLPSSGEKKFIILLDDVVRYCLSEIFFIFGWDTFNAYTIKITRDAEIDLDTDVSKSFVEIMTESLKQRKRGTPVRFVYDKAIPETSLRIILKKLGISKEDTTRGGGRYHNFKDFMSFPNLGATQLEYPPNVPLQHRDLPANKSILASIRQKDIMLHFPYQSFQYIIDLLREVSIDPMVRSIKMTIYRAAKNSSVINALINAARNGKAVTVFMELQARFDEEANIQWTERLQEEGVRVIQGIPGFKVHSKLILIRRKENSKSFLYANIGTGNFNEDTAQVYADDSLLTANPVITSDVENAFLQMEANYKPLKYKALVVAPFHMRNYFMNLLSNEIANARRGIDAWAIIKLNNLVDEMIVQKLYSASNAGVKIRLIIRGICVLKPGIPGVSENIEVISIVDKYLEHSRILVFCNKDNPKYFITSADWMIRNFDNRIEVACPVYDKSIQQELMKILEIQLDDNVKARIFTEGKTNIYKTSGEEQVRSQTSIYHFLKEKNQVHSGR